MDNSGIIWLCLSLVLAPSPVDLPSFCPTSLEDHHPPLVCLYMKLDQYHSLGGQGVGVCGPGRRILGGMNHVPRACTRCTSPLCEHKGCSLHSAPHSHPPPHAWDEAHLGVRGPTALRP